MYYLLGVVIALLFHMDDRLLNGGMLFKIDL